MIRTVREGTEWVLIHIGVGALALLGLWEWERTGLAALRPLWSRLPGWPPVDVTFFLFTGGLGVGLLLGLGQTLTGRLPVAPASWILRSGLGGGLALLIPWGLFWIIGPERVLPPALPMDPEFYSSLLIFGVNGASLGLGVGLAQWTLLRRVSREAWAWGTLTAFGGLLAGWGMVWLAGRLADRLPEGQEPLGWLALGALAGLLFGAMTAWGLPTLSSPGRDRP